MNRPDDNFDDLEQRLHSHFEQRADELHLPPRSWAVPTAQAASRRPATTWLVAASLVVLVAGGAVLLRSRDDGDGGAASSLSTEPPSTDALPGAATPTSTVPGSAPAGASCPAPPDDVESLDLPNDVRIRTLLPELGTDVCFNEHEVTTVMGKGDQFYTVWASCDCDEPTAAVAMFGTADVEVDQLEADSPPPLQVTVNGEPAQLFQPAQPRTDGAPPTAPVLRLYTPSRAFVGWGLSDDAFLDFAEDAIADSESRSDAVMTAASTPETSTPAIEAADDVGDLQLVYSGELGRFTPGLVPLRRQLLLVVTTSGETGTTVYAVARFAEVQPPPLSAYFWALPGARRIAVDAREALAFDATPAFNGQARLQVLVQADERTTVLWTDNAVEPRTAEELAAIPLSEADFTDPRWLDIAYESGQYDAVG